MTLVGSSTQHYVDPTVIPSDFLYIKKMESVHRLTELFKINRDEHLCFEVAFKECAGRNWSILENYRIDLSLLRDEEGQTLLQRAILDNELTLAHDLIHRSISINGRDNRGNLPIHYAASTKRGYETMSILLPHNSLEELNDDGLTPFHCACNLGHAKAVSFLPENGACLNVLGTFEVQEKEISGLSGLDIAVIRGHLEVIHVVMKKFIPILGSFSLKANFPHGSILHLAVQYSQMGVLSFLVNHHSQKVEGLLKNRSILSNRTPMELAVHLQNDTAIIHLTNLESSQTSRLNNIIPILSPQPIRPITPQQTGQANLGTRICLLILTFFSSLCFVIRNFFQSLIG